ncbi:UPF0175 family protein [Hahella ganghwensis]|uniref:UPF0175 family protein n=1 Tax=Hahella ganghwensis TaxID=286420 RepID=UPI0003616749|nr:UPF0175 family protein [Hahella ganghwensis]
MKIEINDDVAQTCGIDEKEALELLSVALYRANRISGAKAGEMVGVSETDFHNLISDMNEPLNYGIDEATNTDKNNNLFGR